MDTENTLYNDVPIPLKTVSHLLLGVGGLVMIPLGLLNKATWLILLALPVLIIGAGLLLPRLHITVSRETGRLLIEHTFLGLAVRRQEYPSTVAAELTPVRVAGAERERPSDTWYLQLTIHTATGDLFGRVRPTERTYLLGKYSRREEALEAHRRISALFHERRRKGGKRQ